MSWGQPTIPDFMMLPLIHLKPGKMVYDPKNGGTKKAESVAEVPFKGCIMPLSEKELQNAPQGTYTRDSRKVYTNGYDIPIGSQVKDPTSETLYTITGDLDHGTVSPIRRYVAQCKGRTSTK